MPNRKHHDLKEEIRDMHRDRIRGTHHFTRWHQTGSIQVCRDKKLPNSHMHQGPTSIPGTSKPARLIHSRSCTLNKWLQTPTPIGSGINLARRTSEDLQHDQRHPYLREQGEINNSTVLLTDASRLHGIGFALIPAGLSTSPVRLQRSYTNATMIRNK